MGDDCFGCVVARREGSTDHEGYVELRRGISQPLTQSIFKGLFAIRTHGEGIKSSTGAQVSRQTFDDAADDLLAVLATAVEHVMLTVDGEIGRVRDDAVEGLIAGGIVEVAFGR